MRSITVSVIIPFFNEEKSLPRLYRELMNLKIKGVILQPLFINDGSTDNSEKVVLALQKKYRSKRTLLLSNKKNAGKGASIKKALKKASGEYILIQDADMEYHPKYIPVVLAPILKGKAEVVFGSRIKQIPRFRGEMRRPRFVLHYIGNRFLSLLTSLMYGAWITDMETGYKVFPKKAIPPSTLRSNTFDIEPEITAKLLKSGYKITEVPITTVPRGYKEGKKLRTLHDGVLALLAIIRFRFR